MDESHGGSEGFRHGTHILAKSVNPGMVPTDVDAGLQDAAL
jgi:hypothetical protein